MARILTARELSTSQLIAVREDVQTKLVNVASRETGRKASDFVIRDSMPLTDFGFATEKWSNQTAQVDGVWTKDWTKTLPKNTFVAFYGFADNANNPLIIGCKFKVGASGSTVRDVAMFSRMRVEEAVKCYIEPVIYKGDETIYIELYQNSGAVLAQYGEELEIFAFVCEPLGAIISGAPP